MRLLCMCVLIVSTAGLCRGGVEERLSRRGQVTVTCRDGNNETIRLWCNMEKLTCSSRGEEEGKNDQFAIQEPYGNHLFRARGQGGQNSDSITYSCHMTGTSSVPSSNLGSLHSENILHGDPIDKETKILIRRASESAENSRENTKEKGSEENKKNKDGGNINKNKKHKNKTGKGNRKNKPQNPKHGDPNDSSDKDTEDEEEDQSHNGNQPGGGNGKKENGTTNETTTEGTSTERTSTKDSSTSDHNEASSRKNGSEEPGEDPVESDILYNVIKVLMVVLLILAVCCFLLWKRKKAAQGQHKAACSSAQVEPEKTLVTVYPTVDQRRNPTYAQPDRIYQEITDTPVDQSRTPQNTPYSIVRMGSQETGASQENIPYSIVSLPSQGTGAPQNSAYSVCQPST